MTLDEFRKHVASQWDEHGACRSCGWHAALYEYGELADGDLPTARDWQNGYVTFPCYSEDDLGSSSHRGARIPLPQSGDANG